MTRALVLLSLLLATAANADDVWVIGGLALKPAAGFCTSQTLGAATTLHNPTDAPLDVTLLDTTDSRPRSGSTLRVPPHRTSNLWFPSAIPPGAARDSLTVWHLDVPRELLVDSQLEIGWLFGCSGAPPPGIGGPNGGMIRLPVFRELVPAGEPKIHMGTNLPGINDVRLNAAVYNAGDREATAQIEVFRAWQDERVAAQTLSVPAHGIVQTTVIPTFTALPPAHVGGIQPLAPPYDYYTRITVDQPSVSLISVLANAETPRALVTISN